MALPPDQVKNQQDLDDEKDSLIATELEKLTDEKLIAAIANKEGLVSVSFGFETEPTAQQVNILASRYISKGWAELKVSHSGRGALLVCLQKKLLPKNQ